MEPHHAQDEAARSAEILSQANAFLEQVKINYQKKPEVYKELFGLLNSYAATRDEAHRHISAEIETLFRGTAPEHPRLRSVLTRTVRMERNTPYAAALVNSAINRVTKATIGSTAAEDSSEERIEDSAMKTTESMIKKFPGFSVDVNLFEGFSQLLPTKDYFKDRPDVYEGYDVAIGDFERRRIRTNRRLYVKARILLQDSPQLFEGFQKFMPASGKGEIFRTSAGKLRWRHYNAEHSTFEE